MEQERASLNIEDIDYVNVLVTSKILMNHKRPVPVKTYLWYILVTHFMQLVTSFAPRKH